MRVALGMIVLDGFPMLPYAIQAAMPHVDKVVIVEGAVPAARRTSVRADGFVSNDGTAELLAGLEKLYDKVTVIRAGLAPSKTAMWNMYFAEVGDCDYVLNLDSDEIISSGDDLHADLDYMDKHKEVDRLDLLVHQFFGDFNHTVHGGMWDHPFRRIWRVPGMIRTFLTHRPPCIHPQERGETAPSLELYHYSWLGVEHAKKKSKFYQSLRPDHPQYGRHMEWYERVYVPSLTDIDFRGIPGDFGLHVSETSPGSYKHVFNGKHPDVIADGLTSGSLVFA